MDGGAWQAAVHGVTKSQTQLSDFTFTFPFMHQRRKWQPTPMFLPGESQGWGSLVGCRLWGCTESDTTEATWQQQQQYSVVWARSLQTHSLCLTQYHPMDCSPPDSSVHGILQTRILEWVAMPFSRTHTHTHTHTCTYIHICIFPTFSLSIQLSIDN